MAESTRPRQAFSPWDRREIPGVFGVEESAKRVAALVQKMANLLCIGRKVFVDRTMDYDSISSSR